MATTKKSEKPIKQEVKKDAVKVTKTIKVDKKISTKPTIAANGNLVSVEYTGKLDNGEEFDNSSKNGPIQFIVGTGQVIKGFDTAVLGMKAGEEKSFKLAKNEAYGDVNPELMHKVPVDKLPADIKTQAKVDGFIVLQAPTGQQIPAKIASIDNETLTLDLNHPLAGKNLNFKIKVVDINEAPHDHEHSHGHDHSHECDCGSDCDCENDKDNCDCKDEHDGCDCGHKH